MGQVWTIARREVKALFDQPTGYVLLIVFLAVTAFLFFRNALLTGTASLRPMMDMLPWVFLFFVPAVAMRVLAEDHRSGLLEVVLAQPVSEAELVLGKALGAWLVVVGALAATVLIPLGLTLGSDLPWGPVVAQYVGAGLLAAAFTGIGVWASSITRSQITAFILSVAVMFVLILVGLDPLLVGLPAALGVVAARLGVLSHFATIGRGVLDLRDVLYFVSVAAGFLVLAYAAVLRRKLAARSPARRRLRVGMALLIAAVLALNLAGGQIRGRLDLTPGNTYTLSPATRAIARSLTDLVTVKLFASQELPAEFALQKRDVDDLLRDLRAAGRGNIRVIERDPADDPPAQDEARGYGITPVQFNVVGRAELQVKEGYLGLAVLFADRQEVIPFIQRTDDLEYRLISAMRQLTRSTKSTVGLATDPQLGAFSALQGELDKAYRTERIGLNDTTPIPADLAALIIAADRDSLSPAERDRVQRYLGAGGKLMVLQPGMAVSPRAPIANPRPAAWNEVLKPYGVQVRQDLVYDLRANQVIGVPTSFGRLLRSYPYFIRAQSTKQSPVNAELAELGLPWTSSIDTTGSAGTARPLFVSSQAAGVASGTAFIDPSQTFPTTDLARRVLAVQVSPPAPAGGQAPRLVVVGNVLFATDDFLPRAPENLAFLLNAVDWLAQDEALIAIRAKDRRPPPLVFPNATSRDTVKYGNIVGLPLLIGLAGLGHLVRRRRLTRRPYRPLTGREEAA